jgi:hypothetical protein
MGYRMDPLSGQHGFYYFTFDMKTGVRYTVGDFEDLSGHCALPDEIDEVKQAMLLVISSCSGSTGN